MYVHAHLASRALPPMQPAKRDYPDKPGAVYLFEAIYNVVSSWWTPYAMKSQQHAAKSRRKPSMTESSSGRGARAAPPSSSSSPTTTTLVLVLVVVVLLLLINSVAGASAAASRPQLFPFQDHQLLVQGDDEYDVVNLTTPFPFLQRNYSGVSVSPLCVET